MGSGWKSPVGPVWWGDWLRGGYCKGAEGFLAGYRSVSRGSYHKRCDDRWQKDICVINLFECKSYGPVRQLGWNWGGGYSRTKGKQKINGQVTDKDGKRFIGIEVSADTDGSRWLHINGRNREDTWWTSLVKFGEKADGSIVGFLGGNPVTSSHFLRSKSLPNSVSSEVRSPCAWHKGCSSSSAIKSPWLMENRDSSRHCRHNLKNSHSMRP